MSLSQLLFRGAALGLAVLLSACSTYTLPDGKPVEKQPEHTTVTPSTRVPETQHRPASPSASSAWQPLLAKAEQATARGDYEQALALLERAQRIDPDSAAVYLGMAKTHRARGDVAQASATAERGLLYCSSSRQCEALRAYVR
jgi:thioredoxin-like negative regulator of GroEL